ncbi:MAG TPA: replication-relaxation family protein [Thermoanaerobaculia bacterium]|nr:replication-relaxation family protein [Thermoanaerobaculia bacterium]
MAVVRTSRTRRLPRDLDGLAAVARFRMLTRTQLHLWKFAGVSDTVVRRFIERMLERGWLGAERLNKNGAQVLWCTSAGRDALVEEGSGTETEFFPGRGPVAAKDMAHTSAIADVAVRLSELGRAGDRMMPAWLLQRQLAGRTEVVPDLLCLSRATDQHRGTVLAVEVDLGGEPIASVLVPKTAKLVAFLQTYAGSTIGVLLLTVGERRRATVRESVRAARLPLPVVVEDLRDFTHVESVRSSRSDE